MNKQILQLVTLKIGNEEYAIEIIKVKEIIKTIQITPIPNTMSDLSLEGIINLRGAVIPIVNLRKKFGIDIIPNNEQTRIIVLDIGAQIIGVIVDAVSEVLRIPIESTEPPPQQIIKHKKFISGIIKLDNRLILLLDLDNIFGKETEEIFDTTLMIEQ